MTLHGYIRGIVLPRLLPRRELRQRRWGSSSCMQTNFLNTSLNPNLSYNVCTNTVGAHRVRPLQRQTIYSYQDFLAAFLSQNRRKEKLTKETPNRLRGGRCYAQGATFWKRWTKTLALVLCKHTAKSQFISQPTQNNSPVLVTYFAVFSSVFRWFLLCFF